MIQLCRLSTQPALTEEERIKLKKSLVDLSDRIREVAEKI